MQYVVLELENISNWIKSHTFCFPFPRLTPRSGIKCYNEIYADVDIAHRIFRLAYNLEYSGSYPITVQQKFYKSSSSFLSCHAIPRIQYVPVVLSAENFSSEFEINGTFPSNAFAENVWRYTSSAQKKLRHFL
jgi:hypothetical protein